MLLSEDKLQSVEKQYIKNIQTENQKWSSQMENRLVELQQQWEQKKKKMLGEEVLIVIRLLTEAIQYYY